MKTKLTKLNIKVGEWCFCDFKLMQITEVRNNKITGVSDGIISMGGNSTDRCYPLDMSVKQISDSVNCWSKKLHKTTINGINYPDINLKLISLWMEMCNARYMADELKFLYGELNRVGNLFDEAIRDMEDHTVGGIKLFRKVIN